MKMTVLTVGRPDFRRFTTVYGIDDLYNEKRCVRYGAYRHS